MLTTKYQSSTPSSLRQKKNFKVGLLWSYVQTGPVLTPDHMNKLSKCLLPDATYQKSKLYSFHFQIKRISKLVFFVPML